MNRLGRIFTKIILAIGAVLSLFPFYWMFVMASVPNSEVFKTPPHLLPGDELWTNIQYVFENTAFFTGVKNTLIVAIISTFLNVFLASLAGFAFAKLEFKGKKVLFIILLGTMMIPGQINIIPLFYLMDKLQWVGTFKALIVPGMVSAFGIFWIKQYAEDAIPDSLLESAAIDGSTVFRSYFSIVLPIIRPALAFLALYSFMGSWNNYLWPLIIINDESKYTLMLVLTQLQGLYTTNYPLVITGSLLATLPLLLIYSLFSRQLISGITDGAVK